jgi:hypothetical protein
LSWEEGWADWRIRPGKEGWDNFLKYKKGRDQNKTTNSVSNPANHYQTKTKSNPCKQQQDRQEGSVPAKEEINRARVDLASTEVQHHQRG